MYEYYDITQITNATFSQIKKKQNNKIQHDKFKTVK